MSWAPIDLPFENSHGKDERNYDRFSLKPNEITRLVKHMESIRSSLRRPKMRRPKGGHIQVCPFLRFTNSGWSYPLVWGSVV